MFSMKRSMDMNNEKFDVTLFILKYGALITLIMLVVFNSVFTTNFFSMNTAWNIIIQSSTTMLLALGMTVVIATGGIDISVGSVMAFSSMIAAKFISQGAIFEGVILALLLSMALGIFTGAVIINFNIQPMIVTLAMMNTVRGISQLINDGRILSFNVPEFTQIAYLRFGGIPIQFILVCVVIVAFLLLIKRTKFGVYVEAYGDNQMATHISGVNVKVLIIGVYALCAFMAGVSGIMETARIAACDPNKIGKAVELDAIAATAIGGTPLSGGKANVIGTVMGAFIMQIITVMVNMNNIPFAYSLVIKTVIVVLAVYLQKRRSND